MAKFRKKPVVIDAYKFDGTEARGRAIMDAYETTQVAFDRQQSTLIIETLEGNMTASPGDWIIRGTAGELYPCKPDIFVNLYEPGA